jgi:NAD-dependent SIR2 family protein deacetylase
MTSSEGDLAALLAFLDRHPRVVVLTGAGISAASGIPTYRDRQGTWLHSRPITHQDFTSSETARSRYWGRSLAGWPAVRDARPSRAHLALAALERAGRVSLLITQNVDRLHQRAGSTRVIDLHGRLDRVRCLDCGGLLGRETVQHALLRAGYQPGPARAPRPDGDAEPVAATTASEAGISPPPCPDCRGILMPDVVFFGGAVSPDLVAACRTAVRAADALLVVGSSLQVYSGFRFCRLAVAEGLPIALINPGLTRADGLATLKIAADCNTVLADLAERFGTPHHRPEGFAG